MIEKYLLTGPGVLGIGYVMVISKPQISGAQYTQVLHFDFFVCLGYKLTHLSYASNVSNCGATTGLSIPSVFLWQTSL